MTGRLMDAGGAAGGGTAGEVGGGTAREQIGDTLGETGRGVGGDSAGRSWTGRTLPGAGFAGDDGGPDARVVAALTRLSANLDEDGPTADAEGALMAALRGARVLVPIVAAPGEVDASGMLTVERSTDMAVVTITSADGRRGLPVFTSTHALARWDEGARPVPVTSARAAQAAVAEGCEVLLLDLGSPHGAVLRPSMLWALAQEREWVPAHADPFVLRAVERAASDEPAVLRVATEAGRPHSAGVLLVALTLAPGLGAADVHAVATRIGERLATDGETRARIDELSFRVVAATS